MSDMQCPYCRADQNVCHDDGAGYTEGVKHEHECSECGKTFVFETLIILYYEPQKADCLNGSDHELKLSRTFPRQYSKMRCLHCEFERDPTLDELSKATHQQRQDGGA